MYLYLYLCAALALAIALRFYFDECGNLRIFWRCRVTVAVSLSVCVCLSVCVHLLAVCRCVSAVCVVFSYWRQALHSSFFSSSVSYLFLVLSIFRLAAAKGFSFVAFRYPHNFRYTQPKLDNACHCISRFEQNRCVLRKSSYAGKIDVKINNKPGI